LLGTQYICLPLIILFILTLFAYPPSKIFAISPAFTRQEIRDDMTDWINMTDMQYAPSKGDRFADILIVNYFSDGKSLNSTFWLFFPFKDKPAKNYAEVNYGILIDADFNNDTGVQGIDYQLEIGWHNNTQKWDKSLKEISTTGEQRTLYVIRNYTSFFEKQKNFVQVSLDLNSVHYPTKYKVIFYAETKKAQKNGDRISISDFSDFTRWVAIPPLELVITTSPTSLNLRPGEDKTIEVMVNSTKGYEPTVFLSTSNQSISDHNVKSYFNEGFGKLRIPTYGVATTPMTISASKDALPHQYTLFIFANSSFPSEDLIKVKPVISTSNMTLPRFESSQNIATESSMMVTVQEPLSGIDMISEYWNKLGAPFTFIYGIIAGISPWIVSKLKKR
jgi:hypothetical protein